MAFIYADGSFRLVKTMGMEYGKVSWTSKGLFFADKDNDYWLAEGQKPKVVPSSKVDTQDTLSVLQDNITHIGVYNGASPKTVKDTTRTSSFSTVRKPKSIAS